MPASRPHLRTVIVTVALVLLLITQLFAVVLTGISAERTAVSVAQDAIRREGETTAESILRHLDPAEQSANVTARLLSDDLLDLSEPGLERYLFTQLAVMPQVTGAFIGFDDGSFVFVSRIEEGYRAKRVVSEPERVVSLRFFDEEFSEIRSELDPADEFDPRVRPWYRLAAESEVLRWTDPYVFFSSGQPGVTAARAVRNPSGDVTAVVGVDVELSGLSGFIDELAVSDNGEAFVVSNGNVVAAPSRYDTQAQVDGDSLRLMTVDELGVGVLTNGRTASPSETVHTVSADGTRDLVLHLAFPPDQGLDWGIVVRAPQADFTAAVRQQQSNLLLAWLIGAALVGISALVLLRVTRPVTTLQHLAATDPLTGLANRRALSQHGERVLAAADRGELAVSVVVIDLDGFKALNDAHGHTAGDKALLAVADHLRATARADDLVGRLGGDEFVVIQSDVSRDQAAANAEELVGGIADTLRRLHPGVDQLGASAGLWFGLPAGRDYDELLREADSALIERKANRQGAEGERLTIRH